MLSLPTSYATEETGSGQLGDLAKVPHSLKATEAQALL